MVDRKITGLEVAGSNPVTITFLFQNHPFPNQAAPLVSYNPNPNKIINLFYELYNDIYLGEAQSSVSFIFKGSVILFDPMKKSSHNRLQISHMAKLSPLFDSKQFYQYVSASNLLPSWLNFLRLTCQSSDIDYIYQAIVASQEIIDSKTELPLTKYHALVVVHQLLQTGRYPVFTFIEILLLGTLSEITAHLFHNRSAVEEETYFVERGYRDTVGIRMLGRKYTHVAAEIIFLAAAIKTMQNILHQQSIYPSKFQLLARELHQKGVNIQENNTISNAASFRQKFVRDLKTSKSEAFSDFMNKKLKEQIIFKQDTSASLKKLIQSQDFFITIPVINVCVSMLSNVSHHFPHQRTYLTIFTNYIRSGSIYAIVMAHNAGFIKEISYEIEKVRGDQSLACGKLIYPEIEASLHEKCDFYCEFLKSLQIWATCLPFNEIGEISEAMQIYHYLKVEKKFIFPEVIMLKRVEREFQDAINKKQMQNDEILKLIESDDTLFTQISKSKSSTISYTIKGRKNLDKHMESVPEQKQNTSFQMLIKQASKCLQNLIYESKVNQNMQLLKQFKKQWSKLKQNYKNQLSSSLVGEGDKLRLKINEIYPIYIRLKKQAISFSVFQRKIAAILDFSLQDFGLNNFDDYGLQSSRRIILTNRPSHSADQLNSSIKQEQNSSISINNLSCWSKIKTQQAKDQTNLQNAMISSKSQIGFDDKNKELIIKQSEKRSEVVKFSHLSNDILESAKQKELSLVKGSKMQQAPSILNKKVFQQNLCQLKNPELKESGSKQYQINIIENMQIRESKAVALQILAQMSEQQSQEPVIFSQNSLTSKQVGQQSQRKIIKAPILKKNIQSAFEVYQLRNCQKQSNNSNAEIHQQFSNLRRNPSITVRSKLYLHKIRYSSTRRAIQNYGQQINQQSQSKKSSLGGSETNQIIKRQYKRLSFNRSSTPVQFSSNSLTDTSSQRGIRPLQDQQNNRLQPKFVSLQKYALFFPRETNKKLVKNCFANKGVLFSNDLLEIGFVHFSKNNQLDFTLFLTPKKNLRLNKIQIKDHENLNIKCHSHQKINILKDKQEVIKIETNIKEYPFSMPLIELILEDQLKLKEKIHFFLPCVFNKYLILKPAFETTIKTIKNSSNCEFVKTEAFKFNRSMLLGSKKLGLSLFFRQSDFARDKKYFSECIFRQKSFLLEISVFDKQKCIISGYGPSAKELQFFVASLCFLLTS